MSKTYAVVKEMVWHEVYYIDAEDADDAAALAMNPETVGDMDHGVCMSERVIAVEDETYALVIMEGDTTEH